MADILMLPGPSVMQSKEVTSFVSGKIEPYTSRQNRERRGGVQAAIMRLESMITESEAQEKVAYKKLGSNSLEEIQQKLDDLNESGLLQLSNKVLQNFTMIKEAKKKEKGIMSAEALEKVLKEEFQKTVPQNITKSLSEEEIFNYIKQLFSQKGVRLSGEKLAKAMLNQKKTRGGYLKAAFKSLSKEQKSKLKKLYQTDSNTTISENGITETLIVTISQEDEEPKTGPRVYPYYGLSPEEKKKAKENTPENNAIWENFVREVSGCCGNKLSSEVASAMKTMKREAFVESGGSSADIIGILGELQALVFLKHFGGQANSEWLGHHLDDNKKKIGIDLALDSIGFQVKNYKSYGTRGEDEGINLRGKYKLSNFLSLIYEHPMGLPNQQDLEKFYAMSVFHVAINEQFQPVENWLKYIRQEALPGMYHGAIAEILPVKQISWVDKEQKQLGTNYFYIIGGTRILPVSKILKLYKIFLMEFREKLSRPRLLTTSLSKYSGNTYKDYNKDQEKFQFSGYETIADSLSINYTVNMNVDYSIEEVITKAMDLGVPIKL